MPVQSSLTVLHGKCQNKPAKVQAKHCRWLRFGLLTKNTRTEEGRKADKQLHYTAAPEIPKICLINAKSSPQKMLGCWSLCLSLKHTDLNSKNCCVDVHWDSLVYYVLKSTLLPKSQQNFSFKFKKKQHTHTNTPQTHRNKQQQKKRQSRASYQPKTTYRHLPSTITLIKSFSMREVKNFLNVLLALLEL